MENEKENRNGFEQEEAENIERTGSGTDTAPETESADSAAGQVPPAFSSDDATAETVAEEMTQEYTDVPAEESAAFPEEGQENYMESWPADNAVPLAEESEANALQVPKKKNLGLVAVLSVIIIALLLVIVVLLVGTKPDFLSFGGFKEVKVGTVNGEPVTEGQLRVFLAQRENAMMISGIQEQYGPDWQNMDQQTLMDALNNFDWDAENADGQTYAEAAKLAAFNDAALVHLKSKRAEEMGIAMTEAEKQQIASSMEQMKQQFGSEEEFVAMLNDMYFKDEQSYNDFYLKYMNSLAFDQEYSQNPSEFLTDKDTLAQYANDEKVSAKHILIMTVDSETNEPLPDDQIAQARAKAEQALARAKAGEDFDQLIAEYNEDPGQEQSPAGYAFGKNEMVPEFEQAAFALGIDEISDIVETDYGFHIIKRVVGMAEIEAQLMDEGNVKPNTRALNRLKLEFELQQEAQAEAEAAASPSPSASAEPSSSPAAAE